MGTVQSRRARLTPALQYPLPQSRGSLSSRDAASGSPATAAATLPPPAGLLPLGPTGAETIAADGGKGTLQAERGEV